MNEGIRIIEEENERLRQENQSLSEQIDFLKGCIPRRELHAFDDGTAYSYKLKEAIEHETTEIKLTLESMEISEDTSVLLILTNGIVSLLDKTKDKITNERKVRLNRIKGEYYEYN